MGDGEWMARRREFASFGVRPSGGGNRPAPRQRKWHDLYQKVKYSKTSTCGVNTYELGQGSITILISFRVINAPRKRMNRPPSLEDPWPVIVDSMPFR